MKPAGPATDISFLFISPAASVRTALQRTCAAHCPAAVADFAACQQAWAGLAPEIRDRSVVLLDLCNPEAFDPEPAKQAYDSMRPLPGLALLTGDNAPAAFADMADLTLAAPCSLPRLIEGLGDLARNIRRGLPDVLQGPDWKLDLQSRTLSPGGAGEALRLTERERDLIAYLARAGRKGAASERVIYQVFGYLPDTETHTLETHVYRLRQKFAGPGLADPVAQKEGRLWLANADTG